MEEKILEEIEALRKDINQKLDTLKAIIAKSFFGS